VPPAVPPIPNGEAGCHDVASPIEPPWKVLPWMDRYARTAAALEQFKRRQGMSDIADSKGPSRGAMIDVLI